METEYSQDRSVQQIRLKSGRRIYRIRCQAFPYLVGFVYLILGEHFPATLIDAGSGEGSCLSDILHGFDVIRADFEPCFHVEDIQRIIITHAHLDHFGGVAELRELAKAEVWTHHYDAHVVSMFNEWASYSNSHFVNYLRGCGYEKDQIDPILLAFGYLPGRVRSTTVDRLLLGNETIDGMKFFHWPGHSAGHLTILLEDVIFIGDIILSQTFTQIWPERLIPFTGLGNYIDALHSLEQLDEKFKEKRHTNLILLPGHEKIIEDVPQRLNLVYKSLVHRNDRLLKILRNHKESMNVREIVREMYMTTQLSRTFFAVCDVGCRIEYMHQLGKIVVDNYDQLDHSDLPVYYFRESLRPSLILP